jgi:glyoxylase-like metal-dependent hydrolase (beta-lactamase superfamily II)
MIDKWQVRARSFSIDRRKFLTGTAAALAVAGLGVNPLAFAATPPHRFKHGAFDVFVVSDGSLTIPAALFAAGVPKAELEAVLKSAGEATEQVTSGVNITLIQSGSDLILFDVGSGTNFAKSAGRLMENLKAAGIDPAKITKVAFTHGHPDHLGGTLGPDNVPLYPNATYFVPEAEWNFWMDPDLFKKMPEQLHGFVKLAQAQWSAVKSKVKTVKPGEDVVTGIRVLDTKGHTPGHVSYEVAGPEGLIIVGDVLPHRVVSFEQPTWRFAYDSIPELAAGSRRQLLDRAVTDKQRIIVYHLPHPGLGRVERKDNAYRFVAG